LIALQSLIEFYDEMADNHVKCPNEPEFQAYYILTHAYSNETISRAEKLPAWVFYHSVVQRALRFASMMARTNEEYIQGRAAENGSLNMYAGVFKQLAKPDVSYLFACCIHLNFVDIRRGALKAMQKAYYCFPDDGRTTWAFSDLIETLGFDDEEEVENTLSYYELPTQTDGQGNKVALIGKLSTVGPDKKSSMSRGNFKGIPLCIS
jgi:hypothetical protein